MLVYRVTLNDQAPVSGGFERGFFSVIASIDREAGSGWSSYLRMAGEGYSTPREKGGLVWFNQGLQLGDQLEIELVEADRASAGAPISDEESDRGNEGDSSAPLLALEIQRNDKKPILAGFKNGNAGMVASLIDKPKENNSFQRFTQLSVKGENYLSGGRSEFLTWLKQPLEIGDKVRLRFFESSAITPPLKVSDKFTG